MRSHEERVFLATAGGRPAETRLRDLLRNGVDLRGVIGLAAAEGVAGNVARLLRGVGGIVLDEQTVTALKELERAPEFRMRFFEQRLRETLRRLDVAGLDVLVTGRAALGYAGYRSFADMTMDEAVFEVGAVREAGAVLTEAGFSAGATGDLFSDNTVPAMHVKVRLRPRSDHWRRAEHVIGLPPRVRVPSRVDRLAEASLQKPGWLAVRDVAVIVGGSPFPWGELPRDRAFYPVLRLAKDYAEVPVPEALLEGLRPPWWRRILGLTS